MQVAKFVKTPSLAVYLDPDVASDQDRAKDVQADLEHSTLGRTLSTYVASRASKFDKYLNGFSEIGMQDHADFVVRNEKLNDRWSTTQSGYIMAFLILEKLLLEQRMP